MIEDSKEDFSEMLTFKPIETTEDRSLAIDDINLMGLGANQEFDMIRDIQAEEEKEKKMERKSKR